MVESAGRRGPGMLMVLGGCRMGGMRLRTKALGIDGLRKAGDFADGEG